MLRRVCPASQAERLGLFMHYATKFSDDEVPDPYYGGTQGFDRVLDMIEDANCASAGKLRCKGHARLSRPRHLLRR